MGITAPVCGPGPAVLVFAREPVAGRVKTRLVPGLSPAQAAELYARMLTAALRAACLSRLGPVYLWHAPTEAPRRLQALSTSCGVPLCVQAGGDLGARMHAALCEAIARHGAAVLMGSDCPGLDAARLRAAARALEGDAPAVFIPAVDGGYVLVGFTRAPPFSLFEDVPWGTSRVMAVTRDRLRALGWRWCELPPLRDVDRVQDLDLLPAGFPWP